MTIEFVIDDREHPAQMIRSRENRRTNKVMFHLQKPPFVDSEGTYVLKDRRSGDDRRNVS